MRFKMSIQKGLSLAVDRGNGQRELHQTVGCNCDYRQVDALFIKKTQEVC